MAPTIYSVFYHSPDGFLVCRTDFDNLEEAENFLQTKLFIFDGAEFHFMLKDGRFLVKGEPRERTEKFYAESMRYAVEIPAKEINKSS
ncbi:hypothetical protein FPZ43_17860 [Mucilaginibacter pallidiroseus]|uniref:Uncharacterized protein n=2 Tax=Mucilaginibacter TaxID=423349 RepID=A0A563U1Q0_9SPHI|nr:MULTISPECIES: hypothetical protein [Mucilaginibacter]TWR24761.1 hypothetical protein FPZ43_17860 [Mucilaginibacter pallidiroseus]TWR25460.1 hypothetical protein FPZ42_12740 [Mucilaginibacter achroorhodeus]